MRASRYRVVTFRATPKSEQARSSGFAARSSNLRRMNITGIDVHTYMVKDLSRAVAFYRDVLQLPLATIGENGAEF